MVILPCFSLLIFNENDNYWSQTFFSQKLSHVIPWHPFIQIHPNHNAWSMDTKPFQQGMWLCRQNRTRRFGDVLWGAESLSCYKIWTTKLYSLSGHLMMNMRSFVHKTPSFFSELNSAHLSTSNLCLEKKNTWDSTVVCHPTNRCGLQINLQKGKKRKKKGSGCSPMPATTRTSWSCNSFVFIT